MKKAVVDASISASWILPDEESDRAEALLECIQKRSVVLVLPMLWYYEMLNVIRTAQRRGRIKRASLKNARAFIDRLPVHKCDSPDAFARQRMLELALRYGLSGYDAAYLELAQRFVIPLYSADARLQGAAKALGLPID